MEKDLPRVFVNPINKEINNNLDIYYKDRSFKEIPKSIDITKKINQIFASASHVYKSKVKITTENDTFETTIVGKSGSDLLSLNGERIHINNIQNIEKI